MSERDSAATLAQEGTVDSETQNHDVFVSYAREDGEFVRRLTEALSARGKRSWVDWADIPPTAEWMSEIRVAIDAADTYLVVLSPASIGSKICAAELDQALTERKRIVPVLARPVDDAKVPPEVAKLHWISFTDGFDAAVDKLVEALDTDLDHVRAHTRLLVRAHEWETKQEDKALLVRGRELVEAEAWLGAAGSKEPPPTALHTRFLLASRKSATRRQRGAISGVTAMFLVAAIFAGVAVDQRNVAVDQRRLATSRELASAALLQLDQDPELSLLLAIESGETALTPEAVQALRSSMQASLLRSSVDQPAETGDYAYGLALSPDGRSAAVNIASNARGLLAFGDPMGSEPLRPLDPTVVDRILAFTFSPDGGSLWLLLDDALREYDASTGAPGAEVNLPKGNEYVGDIEFSPDGKTLVVSAGYYLRVYDANTLALRKKILGESLAFSSDGRRALVAKFGWPPSEEVQMLDTTTWRALRTYRISFTDDGTYFHQWQAAWRGSDHAVLVDPFNNFYSLDVGTGSVRRFGGPGGYVNDFALGPSGDTLATTGDNGSTIRNLASGRAVRQLPDQAGSLSVAYSSDGRFLLTSSNDGTATLWNASTGARVLHLVGHRGPVKDAVFGPDDATVVTTSDDGTTKTWSTGIVGTSTSVVLGNDAQHLTQEVLSADGKRLAVPVGWGARVVEVATGETIRAFSYSSIKNAARVADRGSSIHPCSGSYSSPAPLSLSAAGDEVVIATGGCALVENVDTGALVAVLDPDPGPSGPIPAGGGNFDPADLHFHFGYAVLAPDGSRVLAEGLDYQLEGKKAIDSRTAFIMDVATGAVVTRLDTGDILVSIDSVAFDASGSRVALGREDGLVQVLDASTGSLQLSVHASSAATAVAFGPDGRTLLTGLSSGTVVTWDARTGAQLGSFAAGGSLADVSDDGKYIATSGAGGTVTIWDASDAVVETIPGTSGAAFTPDGRIVSEGTLYTCELCVSPARLLAFARSQATRQLSAAERSRYLHQNT
jgi:WD40 repeat protein